MLKEITLMGYGRDVCKSDKQPVKTIPSFHMIHFIESGVGYYNGHRLTGGQAFVCQRDELCEYYPDSKTPWTYSWINVKGIGADELVEALHLKDNMFYWNHSTERQALERIFQYENNELSKEIACISALYQITAGAVKNEAEPKRDYVSEAKRIFKSNYDRGVRVDDVARTLGISRAYFRNIFYEQMGKSPQAYLMELRMNRAKSLLKGKYSITEIAAAVGYVDVLQFSKIFTKYHNMSPTAFRKKDL